VEQTVVVRDRIRCTRGRERIVESDILHMMSPYQERSPARTPSEIVVSGQGKNVNLHPKTWTKNINKGGSPRVLDNKA
jgi:hypothetical protein